MTVFTKTVFAEGTLDAELYLTGGGAALQAMGSKLAKMIVYTGGEAGILIREDDLWITARPQQDGGYHVLMTWCPDPEEGCEFIGGRFDGDVVKVPRDPAAQGRPPIELMCPYTDDAKFVASADNPGLIEVLRYTRVGINVERHRWVYQFSGSL